MTRTSGTSTGPTSCRWTWPAPTGSASGRWGTTTAPWRAPTWTRCSLGTKLSPLLKGPQALEGLAKSYTDGKTFYTLDVPRVAAAMVARRWLDPDELDTSQPAFRPSDEGLGASG